MSVRDEVEQLLSKLDLESPMALRYFLEGADPLPVEDSEVMAHLLAQTRNLAQIVLHLADAIDAVQP